MRSRKLVAYAALAAAAILAGVALLSLQRPNRVVVRNDSTQVLEDIELVLHDRRASGPEFTRLRIDRLPPGQSATLRHRRNDFGLVLRFTLAQQAHTYTQEYVDLWRGESWLLAVRPDGGVMAGFDHAANALASPASRPVADGLEAR